LRLVINLCDVTESTKLEIRVRELLNSAPDAMLVVDTSGTIGLVNSQTERLFGYAREELIGKPIEELMPERFRQLHLGLRWSYASHPQLRSMGAGLELHGLRKDGAEFPVEISLSPVGSGSEMEVVAAIRDVTVRKEAEKELIATREAALASVRAKSEFLQVMSHELRTPLNVILGLADILNGTEVTAEQRNYLVRIDSNGNALLGLINNILDLAKIKSGQIALDSARFNLDEEIELVTSRWQGAAHAKGLELAVRIASGVTGDLIGDPARLRQILDQLLGNAIKFTDQGEIVLRVKKHSAPERVGTRRLHFSVADTGIGIPPGGHESIFSSFTQGDSSTTRRYGGSGVGLTIVRHLAELMGGAAWVESEAGRGSIFHFTANFASSMPRRSNQTDKR